MSNSLKKLLENAVIDYVDNIITSVPVRAWGNNSSAMPEKCACVHVYDRQNTENSPGLWDFRVALVAFSYISTDKTKSSLDGIYSSLCAIADTLKATPSTITISGHTVHGFLILPDEEAFPVEADFQVQSVIMQAFIEATG